MPVEISRPVARSIFWALMTHQGRPVPVRPDEADAINWLFHPTGPRIAPLDGVEGTLCGRPIRVDGVAPSLLPWRA